MPIPRDLTLTVNPPEEIGTILDVDRRLIGSTHEVYSYISKEQLDQLNTLKWGRRINGKSKNGSCRQ